MQVSSAGSPLRIKESELRKVLRVPTRNRRCRSPEGEDLFAGLNNLRHNSPTLTLNSALQNRLNEIQQNRQNSALPKRAALSLAKRSASSTQDVLPLSIQREPVRVQHLAYINQ